MCVWIFLSTGDKGATVHDDKTCSNGEVHSVIKDKGSALDRNTFENGSVLVN